MANVEKTVEVNLPVSTVYNQWTQFEEFPRFMEGIAEVRQLNDKHVRWRAAIAGHEVEWDAEITDQIPDRQVAWRSTKGPQHAGVITFTPTGGDRTQVTVAIEYDPKHVDDSIRENLGVAESRAEEDLERFKDFIESRGAATGAWRGEIHGAQVEGGASAP